MFSVAWNSFATLAVASFSPDPVVVGTTDAFAITGILNYDIIETDNTCILYWEYRNNNSK
ncbi:1146_t:CDS:2 [Entrophospora sp. SA101]|nr:1146_t:CDS:2 [Entrophospora sp. SA101]